MRRNLGDTSPSRLGEYCSNNIGAPISMHIGILKLGNSQSKKRSRAQRALRSEVGPESKTQRDRERIASRVACAIAELRSLQHLLVSDDVDPRLLTDFRNALNRTRNTAWGVQQYLSCRSTQADSATVMQILAVERIRVAYQLGQALKEDLRTPDLKVQPAHLLELYKVMKDLTAQLAKLVG